MGKIEQLIGQKVKDARERLGWSQKELAKNAKSSETTINRLEKGRQLPQSETLDRIVEALNLTMTDIIPDSEESAKKRIDLFGTLIARSATLDQEQLDFVLSFLDVVRSLTPEDRLLLREVLLDFVDSH